MVVWSSGLTSVAGLIAASGGPFGGNGGFVETSGQSVNFDGIRVNTSAPNGTTGLWLVDPVNLIINSDAAATIASNLANSDVTVETSADGHSGPGVVAEGGRRRYHGRVQHLVDWPPQPYHQRRTATSTSIQA